MTSRMRQNHLQGHGHVVAQPFGSSILSEMCAQTRYAAPLWDHNLPWQGGAASREPGAHSCPAYPWLCPSDAATQADPGARDCRTAPRTRDRGIADDPCDASTLSPRET